MSEHKHTDLDARMKVLLEQVFKTNDEFIRHVINIFSAIFNKLSIKYLSLDDSCKYSHANYENMVQEFVRNCEDTKTDLNGFIHALDEALIIAKYITSIADGILSMYRLSRGLLTCLEPLHALTMLNCCRFYFFSKTLIVLLSFFFLFAKRRP